MDPRIEPILRMAELYRESTESLRLHARNYVLGQRLLEVVPQELRPMLDELNQISDSGIEAWGDTAEYVGERLMDLLKQEAGCGESLIDSEEEKDRRIKSLEEKAEFAKAKISAANEGSLIAKHNLDQSNARLYYKFLGMGFSEEDSLFAAENSDEFFTSAYEVLRDKYLPQKND